MPYLYDTIQNMDTLPTTSNLTLSPLEQRALLLLGQGIDPGIVASAVGVSDSRISQLISDPYFASRVAELRYVELEKHSSRDAAYDSLEDDLLEKLKNCIPYMLKPMEILASIRVINQAKRRSIGQVQSVQSKAEVINLTMPIQIIQQYRVNGNNQVIQAGQQELITIQSGSMKNLLAQSKPQESQNVELLSSETIRTRAG
jgi:hypothetical protein